jgi:hypothetical protein
MGAASISSAFFPVSTLPSLKANLRLKSFLLLSSLLGGLMGIMFGVGLLDSPIGVGLLDTPIGVGLLDTPIGVGLLEAAISALLCAGTSTCSADSLLLLPKPPGRLTYN